MPDERKRVHPFNIGAPPTLDNAVSGQDIRRPPERPKVFGPRSVAMDYLDFSLTRPS